MTNLEIEYKTLLTKDEYNRLLTKLSHIPPITQTNYYIDTPTFALKANRMSLRIRTLPDKAEITLKVPEIVGNREYNVDLSLTDAKALVKDFSLPQSSIKDIIDTLDINQLQLACFGHLTTVRREIETEIGKMALDYNQYANIKDYELELEVEDASKGENDFQQFLNDNHISFKFAKSKVARFSKTLKEQI
ncbi:CYTH domain-containing protein [Streptococcus hongkongensis]|nr:adenylate cyclase [Streptococcus uberis]